MIKPLLISTLVLSSLVFNGEAQAKTYNNIVSCEGSSTFCNNPTKKRQAAYKAAKIHAEKYRNSGTYNIVIQSDSDDSVIEYSFQYFQDSIIIEGPDGRDFFMPSSHVNLSQENILSGQRKESAEYLVSAKYHTKNYARSKNLDVNDRGMIDVDSACLQGTSGEGTRLPNRIIALCRDSIILSGGLGTVGDVVKKNSSHTIGLFASLQAKFFKVSEVEGGGNYNYSKAVEMTQQKGKTLVFITNDGYIVGLKPTKDGTVVTTFFIAPPNNSLPLRVNGMIDDALATKYAEEGLYSFDKSSAGFVEIMANRTRLASWRRLGQLLDEGFVCDGCRVKITDLPTPKQK